MTDVTLVNRSLKLAASIHGAENAPPLLFLHGLALSRDTWEEGVGRLAQSFRVWTLDFRGHGHSDHAASYTLADYVSDASTALDAIGRPAVIVGHSLGGVVAGTIAQSADSNARAVLLEDPPWFHGDQAVFEGSPFPRLFAGLRARQTALREAKAPLAAYLEFVAGAPSSAGGSARDHASPRQLLSQASALQRMDLRCWDDIARVTAGATLSAVETAKPFLRPAFIVQADPACGAALLEGHEGRLKATNPRARIIRYLGSGHAPHRLNAYADRFYDDVERFAAEAFAA
jgi:pimeloyl-ACP methyl ester carboxylesterase